MNNPLHDRTSAGLAKAIEENLFALIPALGRWPRAEVHDEPAIKWSMTDIPVPFFNSIMRARLAPDRVDATIQLIKQQARARNVPVLWRTGPATQPWDLGSHLERHGFVSRGQSPGMAFDLTKLPPEETRRAGLSVEVVRDETELRQWAEVCAAGFDLPGVAAEALHEFLRCSDRDTTIALLGRLNGKPVSTMLMLLAAGVAGLYDETTLPEFRRQGIGAAMMMAALREAKWRGYKVAILHASQMSVSLFQVLGFHQYCRIGQYVWSPQAEQGAG